MHKATTDWFETWFGSPYYKALYANRDELEAQEFVETLINYLQPYKGSTMLDIACGEGRFARQLAEHGFEVTGIDLSEQSIKRAKNMESSNLHFYVHDMRDPLVTNHFDYAFNFFTSFGYFDNEEDHLACAESFAAALKKNGLLVIDYLNKEYTSNTLVPQEVIKRGNYTFHIERKFTDDHIVKEITVAEPGKEPKYFKESVEAFTLADFIHMFKQTKLSLVATFGDYRLNSYNRHSSPRMIMIFKK